RRSRSGRALVTYGMRSKFQGGGGDVVYHSSVSPTHGSLPARRPTRAVRMTLITNTSMPTAITKDPSVEIGCHTSHDPPTREVREERQVEPDEEEPEVELSEALVEEGAEHLRPPVVQPREDPEDGPAEGHV